MDLALNKCYKYFIENSKASNIKYSQKTIGQNCGYVVKTKNVFYILATKKLEFDRPDWLLGYVNTSYNRNKLIIK